MSWFNKVYSQDSEDGKDDDDDDNDDDISKCMLNCRSTFFQPIENLYTCVIFSISLLR